MSDVTLLGGSKGKVLWTASVTIGPQKIEDDFYLHGLGLRARELGSHGPRGRGSDLCTPA